MPWAWAGNSLVTLETLGQLANGTCAKAVTPIRLVAAAGSDDYWWLLFLDAVQISPVIKNKKPNRQISESPLMRKPTVNQMIPSVKNTPEDDSKFLADYRIQILAHTFHQSPETTFTVSSPLGGWYLQETGHQDAGATVRDSED